MKADDYRLGVDGIDSQGSFFRLINPSSFEITLSKIFIHSRLIGIFIHSFLSNIQGIAL